MVGITPAYAGNTIQHQAIAKRQEDHPRLRGEHDTEMNNKVSVAGSPPPTRGTLVKYCESVAHLGITPAYAGNTIGICRTDKRH